MSDPQASSDPLSGTPYVVAGRYEVIRVLGEGSSARTLLCTDLREGRRVAVKELHFKHLEDWKHLELFEREAKVLALLDHRGIPKIFDFFEGPEASTTVFIVQEFIEGASLQQRMDSGPMLGQQEVHDLALSLLDVLEYIHGRAPPVLHRDIKPSNVLVRSNGDAALVDFGGVCFGWQPPSQAGATVVGTFGYMPPEQLLGQTGATSDLYALGATLLHVLTGEAPSDFPFDSGRIEVPPDLPAGDSLTRLIEALLRPAPRDRPQTAALAREVLIAHHPETRPIAVPTNVVLESDYGGDDAVKVWGEHPRFLALGASSRELDGEFRDVYRNLVNPLFPAKKMWSREMHAFWVVIACFLSVISLGTAPIFYLKGVKDRERRYADLLRSGRSAEGVVVAVEEGALYATFKYEFEVAGAKYVGFMEYAQEMTEYLSAGDSVPVLFDPANPTRSCFVYR